MKRHDLSIIIPAAGMGRRMKSYGPKPLIELPGRETVINRQIRILRSLFPCADIVVIVGYESEQVIASLPRDIKIVENEMYESTSVVRSIGMGLRVINHNRVLIVYGDLVFNANCVNWLYTTNSSIVVDSSSQINYDAVGINIVGGFATNFSYGLPIKWAQIVYLTGRELELFKRMSWAVENRRRFGFEIMNKMLDTGAKLRVIEPKGMKIAEIDSSKDIEASRRVYQ